MRRMLWVVGVSLMLSSCGGGGGVADRGEPTPTDPPPAFVGTWVPVAAPAVLDEDGGSPLSTPGDDPDLSMSAARLVVRADGSMGFTDGCNGVPGSSARWTATDDGFATDRQYGAQTEMACPGLVSWPGSAARFVLDGESLSALADDGSRLGQLVRASEVSDSTPSSGPLAREDVEGRWDIAAETRPRRSSSDALPPLDLPLLDVPIRTMERGPYLRLASDGSVEGNDGCNSIGNAEWTVDRGAVQISGDFVSTLIACSFAHPSWAVDIVSLRPDGDRLVAFDGDGQRLGVLVRATSPA